MEADVEDLQKQLMATLLPFQKRIVEELLQEDGLTILANGLTWQKVFAVLLRLQIERRKDPTQRGVLLVLGCRDWQRTTLKDELARLDPSLLPREAEDVVQVANGAAEGSGLGLEPAMPLEVTNETPAAARVQLYQTQSCVFITTRILVVDFLVHRLQPSQVAGLLVLNAHNVTDTSGDGFAVRLFRRGNQRGFIRALSDQPSFFAAGFNKIEKVMKALFVRKLYLWPRFEAHVKDALNDLPIEVVELAQEMTPAMITIYDAIVDLMDACIKELKRANKIDTSEMTLEECLFRSFDDMVRRQLDPVWHTITPKTKQIVSDLKTLRTLAEYLLILDPVTFLGYLENLRAAESINSIWLFHDAAHTIFEQAKKRVFEIQQARTGAPKIGKRKRELREDIAMASRSNEAVEVVPNLEPLPKWALVQNILEEVQNEHRKSADSSPVIKLDSDDEAAQQPGSASASRKTRVLIVAQHESTCQQVQQCMQAGASALLQKLFKDYLLMRLDTRQRARGKARNAPANGSTTELPAPSGGRGGAGGRGDAKGGRGAGRADRLDALRAQRLRSNPKEEQALLDSAKALTAASKLSNGNVSASALEGAAEGTGEAAPDQAAGTPAQGSTGGKGRGRGRGRARVHKQPGAESSEAAKSEDMANGASSAGAAEHAPSGGSSLLEAVSFHALESRNDGALWDCSPGCVIMYDSDVAFVRQLEVYAASKKGERLRIYNLRYENSFEQDKYAAGLRREQSIFEELIRAKGHMVLPDLHQDLALLTMPQPEGNLQPGVEENIPGVIPVTNTITRHGGMMHPAKRDKRRIVVDMREFMSPLPCVLHQQTMDVVPVTLEVGDYILSPEMCVERKSLSDLRQSFLSGRLYNQAEAMTKHYKTPILLIEFDRERAFALHSTAELGSDINMHTLGSKLTLLALHFPRLRVIWSRSLHATADIFRALKANQDDPDPVEAQAVGVPLEADGSAAETIVNTSAIDVLRRLPGVTEGNYRPLMQAAGSLAELAKIPLEQLVKIMGSVNLGRKLREWLDAVTPIAR